MTEYVSLAVIDAAINLRREINAFSCEYQSLTLSSYVFRAQEPPPNASAKQLMRNSQMQKVRHNAAFYYDETLVYVWNSPQGAPLIMQIAEGNRDIPPAVYRNFKIETYLEYVPAQKLNEPDYYFLVTTIKYRHQEFILRIDNAPKFNTRGYRVLPGNCITTMPFAGRTVIIYRISHHPEQVKRLSFSERNVIPTVDEINKYQIFHSTLQCQGFRMKFYILRFGHITGVELDSMDEHYANIPFYQPLQE
ncbi:uncharacterized protein LOC117181194 [Belonocnema kinseyi]|uniref:uncharacterized protein LOC117181194 n=1 Tax=Belonocnema kinseyi TaxID=2817044 RepID=UPI00143E0B69|nr:uncharacterized protein LOC117181194 [Belonocnema kinseyi]